MKKIIKEFKTFIERGNVIDLAVGVVIGSAFSKIVSSLVDDLLMPIIGIIIGGIDFSNLTIKVGDSIIKYGSLINNIINFFIISFCIFIIVKLINKITSKKKEEEKKKSDEGDIQTRTIEMADVIPVVFPPLTDVPYRRLGPTLDGGWEITSLPDAAGEEAKKFYEIVVPHNAYLRPDDLIIRVMLDDDAPQTGHLSGITHVPLCVLFSCI